MRLFIAIAVPAVVRQALVSVQDDARRVLTGASVSWVRPAQFHLTLRFFGEVPDARVPELQSTLETIAATTPPLDLECAGLGVFPSLPAPRVLWAGVHNPDGHLIHWVHQLEAVLGQYAQSPPEAQFRAHLTLARIRQLSRAQAATLEEWVSARVTRRFGAWTANSVQLIASRLGTQGAEHTALAECRLGTK